jgi:Ca-activated chloride channel family protein
VAAGIPASAGIVRRPAILARGAGLLVLVMPVMIPAQPQPAKVEDFHVEVDVDLVVLQATVSDRKGGFASDLSARNFHVYEDGVLQSLLLFRHEDVPVTVGIVVDHSGSMRPKLAHVIEAARAFARSSNPRDQLFVVNFNEHVTMGLPANESFTDRPDEIDAAISNTRVEGQTALYDAIDRGLDRLKSGSAAKKALIVISDGGDNASASGLAEVLKKAEGSNAAIYTLGIFDDDDADRNPDVLRRLARTTGGEAYFPRHLEDVLAICESIARDIRHQYTLGYVSTNVARTGAYRRIRVSAEADRDGKLQVRTRSGYIR